MGLRPPTVMSRERILSFGGAGLGKSFDLYTIARLAALTKSDAKFYIVDTDVSAWRMLSDPAFSMLFKDDGTTDRVFVEEVYDWPELIKAMVKINGLMRPQDWLMVDMVSPLWDWVQADFTEEIFGKSLDEFFVAARKANMNNNQQAFEGWKDWPVINAKWGKFTTMLMRCKGNLYCTGEQKKINVDTAEKDTKAAFGPHGFVPAGQKRLPHLFQTVLWKTMTAKPGTAANVWEMTTVKDRSRAMWTGNAVGDFAKDYLIKTAGWKLA